MSDLQNLPMSLDVSHHNGTIDWLKVASQKPACVFLKATERQWTDPMFERNRRACADLGLAWVPYVFLRPDDTHRTAQYFLDLIGDPTVPAALDWEADGVPASVVEMWIAAMPRLPVAYYGLIPPGAATNLIGKCPRWYPQYPGSATAAPRLPMWDGSANPDWRKCWLAWQWTDKGRLDGISGSVDLNRLACTAEQFAAWYATGDFGASLPNVPKPTPIPDADNPDWHIREAQRLLDLVEDGDCGPITRAAAARWRATHPAS